MTRILKFLEWGRAILIIKVQGIRVLLQSEQFWRKKAHEVQAASSSGSGGAGHTGGAATTAFSLAGFFFQNFSFLVKLAGDFWDEL